MLSGVIYLLALGSAIAARVRRQGSSLDQGVGALVDAETMAANALNVSTVAEQGNVIYNNCLMSERNSCPLKRMRKLTFVYPHGGQTKCFSGAPYAFAVHPGARDKLLIHFAGGGACWQKKYPASVDGEVYVKCMQFLLVGHITTAHGIGAFAYSRFGNAFRGYSTVTAVYCGGGVHVANTVFKTGDGKTYPMTDYKNVEAVRDWTLANFGHVKSLATIGISAGSLGSAMWADDFLTRFRYDRATMIFDSYSGVFPPNTQGEQFKAWGICTIPILTAEAKRLCDAGELTIQFVVEQALKKWSKVNFRHIQAKQDDIQKSFYGHISKTLTPKADWIDGAELHRRTTAIFDKYKAYPNWDSYFVDGDQHCFTPFPIYYTTDHSGIFDSLPPGDLNKWIDKTVTPPKPSCRRRRRVLCK